MMRLLDYLPRGNTLDDELWIKRHRLMQWLLAAHLPALFIFGLVVGNTALSTAYVVGALAGCLALSYAIRGRRPASILVTAGLTGCSVGLVVLSHGSIEAHFHFFVLIGLIAFYQDWVPFLWYTFFTVLSLVIGSIWWPNLIFNHPSAQANPWLWSAIHGGAVLSACVGMVIFWRVTEEEQDKRAALTKQLADAEIGRRRFTSDLLVNLARRNQSMLYRQLDIINQLEEKERDPDALAELFQLDHLATRVRRNAESLLVLSGEKPSRTWSAPVSLRDVVRAAIAETEDLERVDFIIDERAAVSGQAVTDLTHLLAELTENAVRYSSPHTRVTIRTRAYLPTPDAFLLTVEDLGVGMPPDELAATNRLLADPPEVDLSVSQRLGFHVVARLAQRHDISVSLTPTPGGGLTAVVLLPAALFAGPPAVAAAEPVLASQPAHHQAMETAPLATLAARSESIPAARATVPAQAAAPVLEGDGSWTANDDAWAGWWYETAHEQSGGVLGQSGTGSNGNPNGGSYGGSHGGANGGYGSAAPAVTQYSAPPAQPIATHLTPTAAVPPSIEPLQIAAAQPQPATAPARPTPSPRLNRRVPQSHLAPELRVAPSDVDPSPPANAGRASDALSRYQASRQAAQATEQHNGLRPDGGRSA